MVEDETLEARMVEFRKLLIDCESEIIAGTLERDKRLKLDVAQHVPIHGNPGPNADFERIVGPVAARTPVQGGGG